MFMTLLCACSNDIIPETNMEKTESVQKDDTLAFAVNCDSLGEKLAS